MKKKYKILIGVTATVLLVATALDYVFVDSDHCKWKYANSETHIEKSIYIFEAEVTKAELVNKKNCTYALDFKIYKWWKGNFGDDVYKVKIHEQEDCFAAVGDKKLFYLGWRNTAPPRNKEYKFTSCSSGVASKEFSDAEEDLELLQKLLNGE